MMCLNSRQMDNRFQMDIHLLFKDRAASLADRSATHAVLQGIVDAIMDLSMPSESSQTSKWCYTRGNSILLQTVC